MNYPLLLVLSVGISIHAMEEGSRPIDCLVCKCIQNEDVSAHLKKNESGCFPDDLKAHDNGRLFQLKTRETFPHYSVLMRYDPDGNGSKDITPGTLCIKSKPTVTFLGFLKKDGANLQCMKVIQDVATCSEHPNHVLLCMSSSLFKPQWFDKEKLKYGIRILGYCYYVLYNCRTKEHREIAFSD